VFGWVDRLHGQSVVGDDGVTGFGGGGGVDPILSVFGVKRNRIC